jgi:hypothetical protein
MLRAFRWSILTKTFFSYFKGEPRASLRSVIVSALTRGAEISGVLQRRLGYGDRLSSKWTMRFKPHQTLVDQAVGVNSRDNLRHRNAMSA